MRLSVVEKQPLLQLAKHYNELKDGNTPISIEKYNAAIVSVGKSWYFAIMALVIKILPIFIQIITGVLILLL
jgi:hypothetical protein